MTALRFTAATIWWLPTILLVVAYLLVRSVAFELRISRVRRLRRAGLVEEAKAALDRLSRDYSLT